MSSNKEIIYSVIAKNKYQVLCEFTEHKGNFEIIAQEILSRKIQENTRGTVCYEKMYVF